jgi:NADH dehydrogenase
VELAGAIAELARHALKRDFRNIDPTHAKVILIEGGPHILPSYGPKLEAKAVKQLQSLGVEVRIGEPVRGVDESGVIVRDEHIAARTVLWAAGVAATPLTRSLGLPLDRHGRVEVTDRLNPAGLPEVFVIGDAATLTQDGEPVPGVAPAAIQGGRYAAHAIHRRLEGKPVEPFHYRNKGQIATIGRSRAVATLPGGVQLSGLPAWLMYMSVHLFYLSGFRTRVNVFLSWAWSYLTWARGARIIPSAADARAILGTEAPALPVEEHAPAPQLH